MRTLDRLDRTSRLFKNRARSVGIRIWLVVVIILFVCIPATTLAQTYQRCFDETGFCISGRFREFWEQNGGLPIFGFPITPQQRMRIDHRIIQTQWFERARLELHPAQKHPFDVQLGRLGADRLEQEQINWHSFFPPEPISRENRRRCMLFAETGHSVCQPFLGFFLTRGLQLDQRPDFILDENLALFGLPLSTAVTMTGADGRIFVVQWFERARLELHQHHEILIGRLGHEVLTAADPATFALPPEPERYMYHIVAEGDTLATIAERMGSDVEAIAAHNRLPPEYELRVGRMLGIPVFRAGEAGVPPAIIRQGNPTVPKIALTFDIELQDLRPLYAILDTLRARQIKGTFFVTGAWVRQFPAAAQAIFADGHEMANHSFTHPAFDQISLEQARAELRQTEEIIQAVLGVTTRPYFRFPFGLSTPAMVSVIGSEGYLPYFWSTDDPHMDGWLARVTQDPQRGYGAILLLHQRASTAASLPGWLDQLEALGLQPVSLSEVLE